jgi:hypothetical protein
MPHQRRRVQQPAVDPLHTLHAQPPSPANTRGRKTIADYSGAS